MRLGCIDIGSNTTRLLVAERDGRSLVWIHQERAFTAIGHELLTRGELGPAKVTEVVEVVSRQIESARGIGTEWVRLVGTAALRHARNRTELLDAIEAATGLSVEILSEAEEARLAFVGVAGTLGESCAGEIGVVDVGGGSCEIVVGSAPASVRWWASLPLGSATLTHVCLPSDPPQAPELERARDQIAAELRQLRVPHPALAMAVGGSATSLVRVAGPTLDAPGLAAALKLLLSASAAEIAARLAIDVQRARLLPAGILLLASVAEAFAAPLRVGRGGIREGVLLEASV